MPSEIPVVDAGKFVGLLSGVTEALAYKVEREPWRLDIPESLWPRAAGSLTMAIRTAWTHFQTGTFIRAEQTKAALGWQEEFVITLGLQARTILEIFFNVAFMLEDLPKRLVLFDQFAWREAALDLEQYRAEYVATGGRHAEWVCGVEKSLAQGRDLLGISPAQAANPETIQKWFTPGQMWHYGHNPKAPATALPSLRQVMRQFYFENYGPLSGEVHANAWGQIRTAPVLLQYAMPHDVRQRAFEHTLPLVEGQKYGELSLFLLCTICELQHALKMEDADIGARIRGVWEEISKIPAAAETFDLRYREWYPYHVLGR